MLVLGINKILNWVRITTGTGEYTCPIKEINGEWFFKFKNQWHKLLEYTPEGTRELVSQGGKTISRKIK